MMRLFVFALLTASVLPAMAQAADTGWKPSKCGAEPSAPTIDLSNYAKYGESVKKVNQYQKDAQAYNTCVRNEAKTEMDAISKSASAIQKGIWDNFSKYNAAFKEAESKTKK
ncbi:Hypothetical protein GbCGDNIH9_0843 [Granulibacter bethesdensis]|uniref:Secreted protein n=1 Tax=Granulibacter bethesdensis TaxID=364410 RepID=A0AAC9P8E8_9PROT|nr:hypothetical protein [Granulibacter bethesdensis]APH54095.1 Hypothetical protein GbCGDNIH9_0843 [Granulibacter bethesdensis]APH61677.1 Hypothetical protein GbCGDNIH8_0843 [Granulibacter bethesdensis]